MRIRKIKEIILLLSVVMICVVIAEVILIPFERFNPFPSYEVGEHESKPSEHYVLDNKIGWKMKGNTSVSIDWPEYETTYRANSRGFRSPEFKPDDSRKRIVLIGDSYTFGMFVNYEETFGAIIDDQNPEFVVYNLAMPGFVVDQMLLTLQHYGVDLAPDLVVVGLCSADFHRSLTAFRTTEKRAKPVFMLEEGKLRLKTVKDRNNWLIRFLDRHSRVYTGLKLVTILQGYHYPVGKWWHLNRKIIDRINTIGNENNFRVLFIHIPTRSWRNFPMLEKHMKKSNYNFINIRSAEIDDPLKLYYKADPHFNAAGNRFVANEIQRVIDSHPGWFRKN